MTFVEFIGGPFDGHSLYVSDIPDGLATTVALPVNENVFRMLDGESRGPVSPCRTAALYQLQGHDQGRYYFLRSCRASDLDVKQWQA
jgi:hypothetical protein